MAPDGDFIEAYAPVLTPRGEWDRQSLKSYIRSKFDPVRVDRLDERVRAAVLNAAARRQLVTDVEVVLEEMAAEGALKRTSGGRWELLNQPSGFPVTSSTSEDLARAVFPAAFRVPAPTYGRWEDAMIEQIRLYDYAASQEGQGYLEVFQQHMNAQHPPDARVPEGLIHALQIMMLGQAEPVYVGADICELVSEARWTWKLERIDPADPFVPMGFCLLARPIPLPDTTDAETEADGKPDPGTMIRAVAWTSVHSEDRTTGVFWISFYSHVDEYFGPLDIAPVDLERLRRVSPLVLAHTWQWTWGTEINDERLQTIAVPGEDPTEARFRATVQGQTIQALWRLGQQFVPVKHRAPRGLRRDALRRMKRELNDVNVILLRRERSDGDHEETDRHVTVSFLVQGYWARRHTREGIRQVWVRPHIRGSGPFREKRRAWEFRR